ncbi:MAG TPA: trypsin-like peptidase domain-containing protein [Trichormus sp.]
MALRMSWIRSAALFVMLSLAMTVAEKATAQGSAPHSAGAKTTTAVRSTAHAAAVTKATAPVISPEEATNIRIYKTCNRAVVNITSITATEDTFYNVVVPKQGVGSGTIIDPSGIILTNYHVISNANAVKVTLYDGTSYPAQLVGDDPNNDLAVIRIDPHGRKLATIPFGDSSQLEVGRRVFAIGNPFGLDRTLTAGIVSSLGRTIRAETNGRLIKGIIQTDAAINPGNSGGPLIESSGKMVGITTAIATGRVEVQQSAGIGFAIPINTAKRIVPELIAHHGITRPDIGIELVQLTDIGLRVVQMDPEGPAAKAGVAGPKLVVYQDGPFTYKAVDQSFADVITSIDNVPVHTADDLLSYIDQKKPGQVVTLTVVRAGKALKIPVKLTLVSPA